MPQQRSLAPVERHRAPAGSDASLVRFRSSHLLNILSGMRMLPHVHAVRAAVADLREMAREPQGVIQAAAEDDEQIEFSADYFEGELEQIAAALTLERAQYYIERLIKGIVEVRTSPINDINLNRWKEYDDINTDSLWRIDRRDGSGAHTAGYWGNFVPQIPNQMMRRYTRKGDWVLDTFAGSGTTLLEGQRLGRNTIGIELQPQMVEYARQVVATESNPHQATIAIEEGDCVTLDYRALLRRYNREHVQLVIMHPPYFDIIRFSDDPRDLSNAESVEQFLTRMGQLAEQVSAVLERGRYLVVVIGDKYARGDWIPLGFQTMNEVLRHGFSLKSIIVKNFEETTAKRNQKELWRYRALVGGFYVFKHEYIFLFRKQ